MTTEELLKQESNFFEDDYEEIQNLMIKFASYHVEQALKAANQESLLFADEDEDYRPQILECYNLTNIK